MAFSSSSDPSGVLVAPADRRRARSRVESVPHRGLRRGLFVLGLAAVAGAITGAGLWWRGHHHASASPARAAVVAAPVGDERIATLEGQLTSARAELAEAQRATAEVRATAEAALAAQGAVQSKLAGVVGGEGEVTQDGDAIHLQLVDRVLFRVGEAALTDRGRAVLAKVGAALNDVPDKQIWVQGHTDATPMRGASRAFGSNWELSAARALTVVHYLQDSAAVDPHRLAAVAFGQYRPASRAKAKNRRIEIVLYPRHQLAKE